MALDSERTRIITSLFTLAAWTAVTVFGAHVLYPSDTALDELATRSIAWQVLAACALLMVVIRWNGWRDLCFRAPVPGTFRLLWLPALLIGILLTTALLLGLPPLGVLLLVLANSLLVGFSEETMFRGVLFRAFRIRLNIWPAILGATLAFGAVHVLNGFITGDFETAITQSIMAACSGMLLIAILLRTGSLWASIIFHGLWDWATFLIVLGLKGYLSSEELQSAAETAEEPVSLAHLLIPFVAVLPGLIYALWLLRNIRKDAVDPAC